VNGGISLGEWREDFVDSALADVHQHVRIREALDSPDLLILCLDGGISISRFATIVIFVDLLVRYGRDTIIVKLEPSSFSIGLDKSKIVPAV
jgi:hypothetical protein